MTDPERGERDVTAGGSAADGDTDDGAADLVVDCIGMRCPQPVITLARRITEVPVGGTVLLLADDPAARSDVPAWCRMRGQEHLGGRGATGHLVRRSR